MNMWLSQTMSDKLLLLLLLLFFYFSFFISYFSRSFSSGIDTDVSTEPEEYLLCFWFCWSTVHTVHSVQERQKECCKHFHPSRRHGESPPMRSAPDLLRSKMPLAHMCGVRAKSGRVYKKSSGKLGHVRS